jgi:hypothetical protein
MSNTRGRPYPCRRQSHHTPSPQQQTAGPAQKGEGLIVSAASAPQVAAALPRLHNRITDTEEGRLSLDIAGRDFIRANLGFRWVELSDGASALQLERRFATR